MQVPTTSHPHLRHVRAAVAALAAGLLMVACGSPAPDRAAVDGGGVERPGPLRDPEAGDDAYWTTDPAEPPAGTASTFTALVTRRGCSGGTTGKVLRPGVVVGKDEIVVNFTVESVGPGPHTCPGNDQVSYQVDLGQAIGDRTLRDGVCGPDDRTSYCEGDGGVRWRP